MDVEHIVATLLEQDPPAEAVPPEEHDFSDVEDFLVQAGYMGDYHEVERNKDNVLIQPVNGQAANSLYGSYVRHEDWQQPDRPVLWIAIFGQNHAVQNKFSVAFTQSEGLVVNVYGHKPWEVNKDRALSMLANNFPVWWKSLSAQAQSDFVEELNDTEFEQSHFNDACKQLVHWVGSDEQFAVILAAQVRGNRRALRHYAEWPKWVQILSYRSDITRRRPQFDDAVVVDRKTVRVVFDDWSDPYLLQFVAPRSRDFAEKLLGGSYRDYTEGYYPEDKLSNYSLKYDDANTQRLRNILVGMEITNDDGEPFVIDQGFVSEMDAEDMVTLAEEHDLEDIVRAVKYAFSDADNDAQENAMVKYYQEGIENAIGAADSNFIEIDKGKTWKLQFDLSIKDLQDAYLEYFDGQGEDTNSALDVLSEIREKFDPSDRYEPNHSIEDSYFNDQLAYHLDELI